MPIIAYNLVYSQSWKKKIMLVILHDNSQHIQDSNPGHPVPGAKTNMQVALHNNDYPPNKCAMNKGSVSSVTA